MISDDDDDDDDDDELGPSDELVKIYDSIETFFLPATNNTLPNKDYAKSLLTGLEAIEDTINGVRGDPGKLYPLHERVKRVIGAFRDRIARLKSKGYR
jgi:hypothetical protein